MFLDERFILLEEWMEEKGIIRFLGWASLFGAIAWGGYLLFRWGQNKGLEEAKAKKSAKTPAPPIEVEHKVVSEVPVSQPKPEPVQVAKAEEAFAPSTPTEKAPAPLVYSEDYRNVKIEGKSHLLTTYQAETLKNAFDLVKKGFQEFDQKDLLKDVGVAAKKRLRDTFKSNLQVFKNLFAPVKKRKGIFRLKSV